MTSTTQTTFTSYIAISMMYRDAGNYKTRTTFIHPNSTNIPFDSIKKAIEDEVGTDQVLARQWGFDNIAPIDHEDLPTGEDDHCYCEITGISEHTVDDVRHLTPDEAKSETDISIVMQAIMDGGTKDWFDYDKSVQQDRIDQLYVDAKAYGLVVFTKAEMDSVKIAENDAKSRMLNQGC
jgi:hypothetical protein